MAHPHLLSLDPQAQPDLSPNEAQRVKDAVTTLNDFLQQGRIHLDEPSRRRGLRGVRRPRTLRLSSAPASSNPSQAVEPGAVLLDLQAYAPPVQSALRAALDRLPLLVTVVQQEELDRRLRQFVEAILPIPPPGELQERAVVGSRLAINRFIERYRDQLWTAEQVAHHAHLTGQNPADTPSKWAVKGKVFRLEWPANKYRYPAFQFDAQTGKPLAILESVLTQLRRVPARTDWDIAVWFGAANGWLTGDARPADLVASAPAAVLKAATQDAEHYEHG